MVVHETDRNPAGEDAHFVRGDTTNADDLKRAGIEEDVEHFRRTKVDELLVGSWLAAHALARTAVPPGLSAVVADMVAGGDGSELYRIELPDGDHGASIDELATRMRRDHQATLSGREPKRFFLHQPAKWFPPRAGG